MEYHFGLGIGVLNGRQYKVGITDLNMPKRFVADWTLETTYIAHANWNLHLILKSAHV